MRRLSFYNSLQVYCINIGSSKVPLEGFSALQGIGGINKFKLSKVFDKNFDRLPSAHTW